MDFSYNPIQPINLGTKNFYTLYLSNLLEDGFRYDVQDVVPSSIRAALNNTDNKHVLYGPHEAEHPLKTSPSMAKTSLKNDFK